MEWAEWPKILFDRFCDFLNIIGPISRPGQGYTMYNLECDHTSSHQFNLQTDSFHQSNNAKNLGII